MAIDFYTELKITCNNARKEHILFKILNQLIKLFNQNQSLNYLFIKLSKKW